MAVLSIIVRQHATLRQNGEKPEGALVVGASTGGIASPARKKEIWIAPASHRITA